MPRLQKVEASHYRTLDGVRAFINSVELGRD